MSIRTIIRFIKQLDLYYFTVAKIGLPKKPMRENYILQKCIYPAGSIE